MTDAGLERLGPLATLRYAYVSGTKVTDAGKKRLKELPPKCSVY